MKGKPNLREAIEKAKFWDIVEHGYSASYTWTGRTPSMHDTYSVDEFAAIDPRLVEILEHIGDGAPGQYLRNALDWWSKPRMTLPLRNNFGRITGEHVVKAFDSFSITPGTQDVTVKFIRYEITTRTSGTSYPSSTQPYQVEVPRYWLAEHYPKWEERYLLAKSLDMDQEAMTKFITEPCTALTSVPIETIEFE